MFSGLLSTAFGFAIGTVGGVGAAPLAKFAIFEFFSLIFAQILMKFCQNFADNLENVEIF